jgi:phosphoribosylformylglycinamidine synthase
MFAALKEIVPGAASWPRFVRNRGEQFEGRFSLVELARSPSIFFDGMDGSMLPIAVAHGEGRAEFAHDAEARVFSESGLVSARYIEGNRKVATDYPANPNGSPYGNRRDHQCRRARDHHHAAPGTFVPLRAEFLAPGWGG